MKFVLHVLSILPPSLKDTCLIQAEVPTRGTGSPHPLAAIVTMTRGVGGNLRMTDTTTRRGIVGGGELITLQLHQGITGGHATKNQVFRNLGMTGRSTMNRATPPPTIPSLLGTRNHWLHTSQEVGLGERTKRGSTLTRSTSMSSMRTSRLKEEVQAGTEIKGENAESIVFKTIRVGTLDAEGKSGTRPVDGTNRHRPASVIQMRTRTAHGNQGLLGSAQTGINQSHTRTAIGITTSSQKGSKNIHSRNINEIGETMTTI